MVGELQVQKFVDDDLSPESGEFSWEIRVERESALPSWQEFITSTLPTPRLYNRGRPTGVNRRRTLSEPQGSLLLPSGKADRSEKKRREPTGNPKRWRTKA